MHVTQCKSWPNEKITPFVKFFFLLLVCTSSVLLPSSSAIKVFSTTFPRPHAVEELECYAIINLSNGVPSSRMASKGYFLLVVTEEGKKKDRAGPLQSRAKELVHI